MTRRFPHRPVPLFVVAGITSVACGDDAASSTSSDPTCASVELVVAASDYDNSSVLCGAPGCIQGRGTTGLDLGSDPALASSAGRDFYLARDLDLIFEVDPKCGTANNTLGHVSLHDLAPPNRQANPHDVAAAPDGTLVVPLYNAAKLAFVQNKVVVGSIDLAQYDADGNPQAEAVSIVTIGGQAKAFVTLERLDDHQKLASVQSSQILRVDVASRTVESVVELAGRNPFNTIAETNGILYLAEPGNFDSATDSLAGIERFDTATSQAALLVHERDLGGSVAEVAVTTGCGVAIVAGAEANVNPTKLATFDPDEGTVIQGGASGPAPVLGPTPGYDLQGLAWTADGNTLYAGDRRQVASDGYPVHVFAKDGTCHLTDTGRTILLPQKPVAIRASAR